MGEEAGVEKRLNLERRPCSEEEGKTRQIQDPDHKYYLEEEVDGYMKARNMFEVRDQQSFVSQGQRLRQMD